MFATVGRVPSLASDAGRHVLLLSDDVTRRDFRLDGAGTRREKTATSAAAVASECNAVGSVSCGIISKNRRRYNQSILYSNCDAFSVKKIQIGPCKVALQISKYYVQVSNWFVERETES